MSTKKPRSKDRTTLVRVRADYEEKVKELAKRLNTTPRVIRNMVYVIGLNMIERLLIGPQKDQVAELQIELLRELQKELTSSAVPQS